MECCLSNLGLVSQVSWQQGIRSFGCEVGPIVLVNRLHNDIVSRLGVGRARRNLTCILKAVSLRFFSALSDYSSGLLVHFYRDYIVSSRLALT